MIDVMYEQDDPGEIAACIYEIGLDTKNTRHLKDSAAFFPDEQRQCGCKWVRNCDDLDGYGFDAPNTKIVRAMPSSGWWWWEHCPETVEVRGCLAITSKECGNYRRGLQQCLAACDNGADNQEAICSLYPTPVLKKLCNSVADWGEEACREYCRRSMLDYRGGNDDEFIEPWK